MAKPKPEEVADEINKMHKATGHVDVEFIARRVFHGDVDVQDVRMVAEGEGFKQLRDEIYVKDTQPKTMSFGRWTPLGTGLSGSGLAQLMQQQQQATMQQMRDQMNQRLGMQQSVYITGMNPYGIGPNEMKKTNDEKPKKKIKAPFKKGDRVIVQTDTDNFKEGDELYVVKMPPAGETDKDAYCGIEGGEGEWIPWKHLQLVPPRPKVSMESVIIAPEKREVIQAAISQVRNNDKIFSKWGFSATFEKGTAITLLFWGIPGTGKTLMAQAIADQLDYDLKIYGTAEIESSEPGGAERMMKQIFSEAKKANKGTRKRIILLDECDSLLMDRSNTGPILGAQINTLLQEIERYEGILILTTNRLGTLDAALERRITTKVEFTFPDRVQREAIWKRLIPEKAPIAKDVDFAKLAMHHLAGGNIKNAVLNAARSAAYQDAQTIEMNHFLVAVEQEKAAMQAFVDQYDQTPHSRIRNDMKYGENGSLSVNREVSINKKISLKGVFDGNRTEDGREDA